MSVSLLRFYDINNKYELCIDEAGRGCMFGRVYIACVVLPKDPESFLGKDIKDSKKFSSKKKINTVAQYIKEHALVWHVAFIDASIIDEINILQAVMKGMHECIRCVIEKINNLTGVILSINDFMAVVDGNYFSPFMSFDTKLQCICELPHVTVEQGDAKYIGIAAASILAKTERDNYVQALCVEYPILAERYALNKNMGYGTKAHMDGIVAHGITQWHRKTFGCCKTAASYDI
jgi:ribonuclease HII